MPNTCARVDLHGTTAFAFNLLLHILILFTLLCGIYVLYISKVETSAFKSEINSNVQDNLPKALLANDRDGVLKKTLQGVPLDKLAELYAKPQKETTTYNTWLVRTMVLVAVSVLAIVVVSGLFLYFSCNQCVPFWDLVKENAVIFMFVGVAEIFFFLMIASKFVPCPPSTLVDRVFTDLKNWG